VKISQEVRFKYCLGRRPSVIWILAWRVKVLDFTPLHTCVKTYKSWSLDVLILCCLFPNLSTDKHATGLHINEMIPHVS